MVAFRSQRSFWRLSSANISTEGLLQHNKFALPPVHTQMQRIAAGRDILGSAINHVARFVRSGFQHFVFWDVVDDAVEHLGKIGEAVSSGAAVVNSQGAGVDAERR